MAIKFISVKCPECGANLPMEEGRKEMFCSYCGTKVIMTNENEHVYRHVDEAQIRQAEVEREIVLKSIEYAERKRLAKEKHKKIKLTISIIVGILAILFIIIGIAVEKAVALAFVGGFGAPLLLLCIWINDIAGNNDEPDIILPGQARVPDGILDYQNKSYTAIEALFRGAGFTNIKCIPLNDLWTQRKQNLVESIAINGKGDIDIRQTYQSGVPVVITYHCKKR